MKILKPFIYLELNAVGAFQTLFYKFVPDKNKKNSFCQRFEWAIVKRMLRLNASIYDDIKIEDVNCFLGVIEKEVIKKAEKSF